MSVVMSVRNGGRYLRPALDSILGQTLSDLEFIVIDDGSDDETATVLAEYTAREPRLKVLTNPENLGLTHSLNRGLGLASGLYLARQDADDLSRPERLAQQAAFMEARPEVGVVGTLTEAIDDEGKPLRREAFPRVLDNHAIQRHLLQGNCLCHGSVLVRRNLLEAVGNYDASFEPSEDYELWLRLAEVSQIANLEARLYQYRLHSGSVSANRRLEQALSSAKALESALIRRNGSDIPATHQESLALLHLEAALCALKSDLPQAARDLSARALALRPSLVADEVAVTKALEPHIWTQEAEAGATFLTRAFKDLFPRRPNLIRLRARLIARLHMREVFAGAKERSPARGDEHLWPALRHDPAWLLNRGVIAILARSVVRRWQALLRRSTPDSTR